MIGNLLEDGNLATLLLATINTIQKSKIREPTVWRGFRDFYTVLESELGLQYGRIILALASNDELGAILAQDWPYMDAYRREVDGCFKGNCSGIRKLLEELEPAHLASILSPHLTETGNQYLPFALIPFCEYGRNMSKYGKKIPHMNLPVCSHFNPTLISGQLCYTIKIKGDLDDDVKEELSGLNILLDPVPVSTNVKLQSNKKIAPEYNMLTYADKSETTKVDIYFSTMEGFRGVGDKEYTLTALKLMTATDAFLGREERFRGCSLTSFEECYAEMFLKEVVERCHCIPWSLSPFLHDQVKNIDSEFT